MNKLLKVKLEIQDIDQNFKPGDNFAATTRVSPKDLENYDPHVAIKLGAIVAGLIRGMVPAGTESLFLLFEEVTPRDS